MVDVSDGWTTIVPGVCVCVCVCVCVVYYSVQVLHVHDYVHIMHSFFFCRINNCVGELNFKYFFLFLVYTGKCIPVLYHVLLYRSLAKERPWAEHLTSPSKRGVGVLLNVSAFNHERAPMSCLQRLDALEANNYTNNNVQWSHQRLQSQGLTAQQHSEQHHATVGMV